MRRILFVSLFFLTAFPAYAAEFQARVVGITDGDTITVLRDEKSQVKIRLAGIDAPESGQDFGSRAKQAASGMAFGKSVTVRSTDIDRYGRTVADVILPDGKSLNQEMVGQGMAWWYRQYAPHDLELATLESGAKAAHRGLWSQPGAIPPWNWRKGEGVPQTAGVIGNRKTLVYHRPTCRGVAAMKEANKQLFDTTAQAEKAGYRKAKDCK